jgi:hypothetical protein
MPDTRYYIEAETAKDCKHGQTICGDACFSRKIKDENRLITVLSDGLGSGIKANVLATMTTSMALQFTMRNDQLRRTANFLMNTLPTDQHRQMSYATFSIVDINCFGEVNTVEYDSPSLLLHRNKQFIHINKSEQTIDRPGQRLARIQYASFNLQKEDRLILVSDGITQAGIGSQRYPFGWGLDGVKEFINNWLNKHPYCSARQLSQQLLQRARHIDTGQLKDDATCHVIYCRDPRRLLIATGPPYHKQYDKILAERIDNFKGKRIICGGTTSKILSRELNSAIEVDLHTAEPGLPPIAHMKNMDLVTEGILTLGKVSTLLESMPNEGIKGNGPAEQMIRLLLNSDEISFLAGTTVNNAHQDPNLPVELEIRRNVVKKIATLLEDKFLKTVSTEYI